MSDFDICCYIVLLLTCQGILPIWRFRSWLSALKICESYLRDLRWFPENATLASFLEQYGVLFPEIVGRLYHFGLVFKRPKSVKKQSGNFRRKTLMNLRKYHACPKLMIDGLARPASSRPDCTLPLCTDYHWHQEKVVHVSGERYSKAQREI